MTLEELDRKHVEIHPTGTCFEDMTWYFARRIRDNRALMYDEMFVLVHGICGPNKDVTKEYSHAWVEHGDLAFFSGVVSGEKIIAEALRESFLREFRVIDSTRYTFAALRSLSATNGDQPPPWEEKYRRLCKDHSDD